MNVADKIWQWNLYRVVFTDGSQVIVNAQSHRLAVDIARSVIRPSVEPIDRVELIAGHEPELSGQ